MKTITLLCMAFVVHSPGLGPGCSCPFQSDLGHHQNTEERSAILWTGRVHCDLQWRLLCGKQHLAASGYRSTEYPTTVWHHRRVQLPCDVLHQCPDRADYTGTVIPNRSSELFLDPSGSVQNKWPNKESLHQSEGVCHQKHGGTGLHSRKSGDHCPRGSSSCCGHCQCERHRSRLCECYFLR